MEQVKKLLEMREYQLQQVKREKERALKIAPEGSLRVCCHGNKVQYYHRNDPKDFNGVYIREKDVELAQKLAQKDYDKKVLRAAEKELSGINKYFSCYPERNMEEIYDNLHRELRKLIEPILMPTEQFVSDWEQVEYQGKDFYEDTPRYYTVKGECVRSKSEVIIADILNREGIPYRYEYPIHLKGQGRIYPDFTVLNVRTRQELLWEHLGRMDDAVYAEKAIQKIMTYEKNGFFPGENLILTYETRKVPLNQKIVMLMIQRYLK